MKQHILQFVVLLTVLGTIGIPHHEYAISSAHATPPALTDAAIAPPSSAPSAEAAASHRNAISSKSPEVIAVERAGIPQLSIPNINLKATIVPVGTDPDGKMSVPLGRNEVGWYRNGTLPGKQGSAVLAAHVYLAFHDLKNVRVGSDLYVKSELGSELHFVVVDVKEYSLAEIPAELVFNQSDTARLNLVTCSGTWLSKEKTYDHRLVIYTRLVAS